MSIIQKMPAKNFANDFHFYLHSMNEFMEIVTLFVTIFKEIIFESFYVWNEIMRGC